MCLIYYFIYTIIYGNFIMDNDKYNIDIIGCFELSNKLICKCSHFILLDCPCIFVK